MTLLRGHVATALVGLTLVTGCAKEEIVHGLSEYEANEILVVLEANGLKPIKEKEEGGRTVTYKVVMPGAEASDARKILVDNKLPRPQQMGLGKVYDPANKGLIPTATEEKAGYQMALHGEIVAKLKTIPGVLEAHVTVVKPDRDIVRDLNDKPPPATASVVILYNTINGTKPFKEQDIQKLVAASVEGMDPANVTVVATANVPADRQVSTASAAAGGEEGGGGIDKAKAPKVMGVVVADDGEKNKLNRLMGMGAGAIGILLLAVLILLGAFTKVRGKVTQLNAEVAALKKARARAADAPPAA
ncbi:MAG: hypothetical protein AB2A00_07035 [Myxococcota bacterium]